MLKTSSDDVFIPLSAPDTGDLERDYVTAAMDSGWVAPAGPELARFEHEVASRVGATNAVALASGTAALHLALVAWGVGPGDTVPVSTLTFAATVNAIAYTGAEPYFVDCDLATGNMSASLLDAALSHLRQRGKRVPAVIPVDLLGKCADYEQIERVCAHHGVKVLCDSAESFGANYRGVPSGSFGDASVFSFNGNKIMTTSGGGMLITQDEQLAERVRYLSTQARLPVEHYEHVEVGYNYRLSNILAALGRAQLSRLDKMLSRRRQWRDRYTSLIADVPGVSLLGGPNDSDDNCWLTCLVVESEVTGWTAENLRANLKTRNIESRALWKPMHMQQVWAESSGEINGTAEWLFERGITLPSGSSMSDQNFDRVLHVLHEQFQRN